jgi:hypothetical protein
MRAEFENTHFLRARINGCPTLCHHPATLALSKRRKTGSRYQSHLRSRTSHRKSNLYIPKTPKQPDSRDKVSVPLSRSAKHPILYVISQLSSSTKCLSPYRDAPTSCEPRSLGVPLCGLQSVTRKRRAVDMEEYSCNRAAREWRSITDECHYQTAGRASD